MPEKPERIRLHDGPMISRLVCGLWQVADMEKTGQTLDPARAADALDDYAKAGFLQGRDTRWNHGHPRFARPGLFRNANFHRARV